MLLSVLANDQQNLLIKNQPGPDILILKETLSLPLFSYEAVRFGMANWDNLFGDYCVICLPMLVYRWSSR